MRKNRIVWGLLVVVVGLAAACGGRSSEEQLLQDRCTACHGLDLVEEAQKTREEWNLTVFRMVGKGTRLNEDEQAALVEYLAENDAHGILIARDICNRLDWNKGCDPLPRKAIKPPAYDPEEIAGVVPVDYRTPYDVHELIARIVDGSDFVDFKSRYDMFS